MGLVIIDHLCALRENLDEELSLSNGFLEIVFSEILEDVFKSKKDL